MPDGHLENPRHSFLKIKICVSGAAETSHCGQSALDKALELGREIAKHNCILVTGATTGFPLWTAKGAKEAGGISIGFSPASTKEEHVKRYGLPLDYLDLVVFTGFDYSGRNLILTRSSDAVIVGCGRMGTINEFTIAFEDKKPIGILEGEWETDEVVKTLIEKSHRAQDNPNIVFDSDPKRLVEKIIEMVKKENQEYQ